MGQEWRDQAYTARVLADALAPLDIGVAVKEHAHFMWRRDPDYWPQFDAHPNIATIDPFADSRELMKQAVFTVTATGTVGLEAGLLGLPVVTGAEMPWSDLGNVAHLACPDDLTLLRRAARLGVAARRPGEHRRVVRARLRAQLVGGARARPAAGAGRARARQHPQGGCCPRRGRGVARAPARRTRHRSRRDGLTWTPDVAPDVAPDVTAPGRGWVVLGAGGHARSVVDVLERAGHTVVAVAGQAGGQPWHVEVLTDDAEALALIDRGGLHACVAIGANAARARLVADLVARGVSAPPVVATTATVSPRSRLGAGTVVLEHAHVGPAASAR